MLEKGAGGFNAKLRAALKDCGCFVSQIESETGRGIPDFHASHVAVGPFWVECKVSFTVKKVTVEVRPNQIIWHESNHKTGGAPSWIAVCAKKSTEFILFKGEDARRVFAEGDKAPHQSFPSIEAMAEFLADQ